MQKYHYDSCGLNNVYITGIYVMKDDDGDEVIQIPAINLLHRVIAEAIIYHKNSMSGEELRFIRTEIGFTQTQLGEFLSVDRQTIGRWERNEVQLEGPKETLIRVLANEKLLLSDTQDIQDLAACGKANPQQEQPINIAFNEETYSIAA